jgi:hypothetical protein
MPTPASHEIFPPILRSLSAKAFAPRFGVFLGGGFESPYKRALTVLRQIQHFAHAVIELQLNPHWNLKQVISYFLLEYLAVLCLRSYS